MQYSLGAPAFRYPVAQCGGMEHGLLIGCVGYDYPQWEPEPYPEDLPPDWRFCYYSNEVRSVVLPATALVAADAGLIQAWADDSGDRFQFVLELTPQLLGDPPAIGFAALEQRLQPIAEKLAAVAVLESVDPAWLNALHGVLEPGRVLCSSAEHAAAGGRVWYTQRGPAPPVGDGVLLALVDNCGLKELRSTIERLQRQSADCGLFFCDPETAWQQVLQAQQLADLMGVATGW